MLENLHDLKVRRKQLGREPSDHTLEVRIPKELDDLFLSVKNELFTLTRKRLTQAFVFRKGAFIVLRQLQRQIARAKNGRLHAKPRSWLGVRRVITN